MEKKKLLDKCINIAEILSTFSSITGITLLYLLQNLKSTESLSHLTVAVIILYSASILSLILSISKYRSQLVEKEAKLHSKGMRISELNGEIKVLNKVLSTQMPRHIGYYLTNKNVFQDFKTSLTLSACQLDMCLIQNPENNEDFCLQFEWTLDILNSTNLPITEAKFIYPSSRGTNFSPEAWINDKKIKVSRWYPKQPVNEYYHFISIKLHKPIHQNQTKKLKIKYSLSNYAFNQKYDYICLVPNALGFRDTTKIRVHFYTDSDVIKSTTTVMLKSYKLDKKYVLEQIEELHYKNSNKDKYVFSFKRENTPNMRINDYGFLMVLINDKSYLPDFLQEPV